MLLYVIPKQGQKTILLHNVSYMLSFEAVCLSKLFDLPHQFVQNLILRHLADDLALFEK